MDGFYFSQMNKQKQAVYYEILSGVKRLDNEITVPRIEPRELSDLLFLLRLDHPEIFWVGGFKYRFFPDSPHLIFIPEYLMDKGKIREAEKAMKSRVEKLVRPWIGKTPAEQEKLIHDFLCTHVVYDKLKKPYSHEITGPLGQGVGVCEGIAKSVKVLADALSLKCIIALSDNAPEKGIKYRHTWNILNMNGRFYHLDVTFDLSLTKEEAVRYDYFNLDDTRNFRDHEPVIHPVPKCIDGDGFYYRVNKLSFTKDEDVRKRAEQAAKKGKELTFHWRGGYLNRESTERILGLLADAGKEKGKEAMVRLNLSQAVFQVQYVMPGNGSVAMEKADADEASAEETNIE